MKRYLVYTMAALGLALAVGVTTAPASAQATRTWVSGLGDDANPCSRTAPCKTFAGAYSRTAIGGEIDVLDPGGFGTLSPSHSITIEGGGSLGSVLSASTIGININAGPADVIALRRISIDGVVNSPQPGTDGIRFNSGLVLSIEDCVIQNVSQYGINFQPSGNAILAVSNSYVRNATLGGIRVAPTGGTTFASVTHSRVIDAGFGILATGVSRVQITDTTADADQDGFMADGASAQMAIESSVATNNSNGIHAKNSGKIQMSNTMYSHNFTNGLFAETFGQIISWGNNRNVDNINPGAPTSTVMQQ